MHLLLPPIWGGVKWWLGGRGGGDTPQLGSWLAFQWGLAQDDFERCLWRERISPHHHLQIHFFKNIAIDPSHSLLKERLVFEEKSIHPSVTSDSAAVLCHTLLAFTSIAHVCPDVGLIGDQEELLWFLCCPLSWQPKNAKNDSGTPQEQDGGCILGCHRTEQATEPHSVSDGYCSHKTLVGNRL